MTAFTVPRKTATTVTGNATAQAGHHNPADATSGPLTLTLPTATNEGASLSIGKVDSTTNLVTITGTIDGTTESVTLAYQGETLELDADAAGSWHVVSNNLPRASLSATYLEKPTGTKTTGYVPVVQSDGTTAWAAQSGSGTVSDATTSSKGVVQLAGDLAGTATSPALKTIVAAGSVGSATQVPVITFDAKGRITSASQIAVSGGGGGSTNSVNPFQYGAVGDGATDDTAALNDCYTAARSSGYSVSLLGRKYKTSSIINARGVSTIGDGATIVSTQSGGGTAAFAWGGSNTSVDRVIFDMTNTNSASNQFGVLNDVNNANYQSFTNNVSLVRNDNNGTLPTGANQYGPWFSGTGLTGLLVQGNYSIRGGFGIWFDNSTSGSAASNDLKFLDNVIIDGVFGINCPGSLPVGVRVSGNSVRSTGRILLDMPISVAHCRDVVISNNQLIGNDSSSNGCVHIEDASGKVVIADNTITTLASLDGIILNLASSGYPTTLDNTKVVITGNYIQGSDGSNNNGILCNDAAATRSIISDNYVSTYGTGVSALYRSSVHGNTVENCAKGIAGTDRGSFGENTIINCTNAYYVNGAIVTRGSYLDTSTPTPVKQSGGSYVQYQSTTVDLGQKTLTGGTAITLFALPSGSFNGTVTVHLNSNGWWRYTVSWNGTTFTATAVSSDQQAGIGISSLSKSGSNLQMTPSASGTVYGVQVVIDGLVY